MKIICWVNWCLIKMSIREQKRQHKASRLKCIDNSEYYRRICMFDYPNVDCKIEEKLRNCELEYHLNMIRAVVTS